jgi:hypothetical protein
MEHYMGIASDERRTRALEIAVAILGPMEKSEVEKADKQGIEIIKHYSWLLYAIDNFIALPDTFDNLKIQL